jgi:hypothetical protein
MACTLSGPMIPALDGAIVCSFPRGWSYLKPKLQMVPLSIPLWYNTVALLLPFHSVLCIERSVIS